MRVRVQVVLIKRSFPGVFFLSLLNVFVILLVCLVVFK